MDALRDLAALFRRLREGDGGSAAAPAPAEALELVGRAGADALLRALGALLARQVDDGPREFADHEFLDALQAALWALRVQAGEELRRRLVVWAVDALHAQNAQAAVAAATTDVLLRELQHLRADDLPPVVDEVVKGVSVCQQSQRQRRADGAAIFYTLELLPQLLMRVAACPVVLIHDSAYDFPERCSGTEYMDQVMHKLAALAWPKRFFLQFLKTFREFPLSDDLERQVCAKIYREACAEISVRSSDARANNFELLPTVFHNVLLLVLRLRSEVCKRIFVRMLVQQCALLARSAEPRVDYTADTSNVPRTLSVREVRALQSTILYHFDIVLKQDAGIAKLFLVEYEARTEILSSFDIAILMTISHGPNDAKVFTFLSQRIMQSYTQEIAGGRAGSTVDNAVRSAFLQTIPHAAEGSWSSVSMRMMRFAFQLMEVHDKKVEELLDLGNQTQKAMHLPWIGFGIRLVIDCFRADESARERIIDSVMNGVIVQNAGTKKALLLLARIVQRHAADLTGQLGVRIREGFEFLIHMTPKNARLFLYALGALLKVRPNLKGFLILTLRKAMFRKDEASRIIGIQGFSFMLCLFSQVFKRGTLTQLYSQNADALLSQGMNGSTQQALGAALESQSEVATQEQSTAIVAEDLFRQFCGVFKRAFQLQTTVRLVLYAELLRVFRECPSLQPPILDLVYRHFSKYYEANETILPPLKLDSCLSTHRRGTYEEPVAYLVHAMLTCIEETRLECQSDGAFLADELIPATQTPAAQRSFSAIDNRVSVLMERMKRCEIADFDLDKSTSLGVQSGETGSTRQLARMLCEVLEVSMNWLIISGARSGGIDQPTWEALAHYLHMHRWITDKLGQNDTDASKGGENKSSRKRGRPPKSKAKETSQQGEGSPNNIPENAPVFREHAIVKDALLLTPFSIAVLMDSAREKVSKDPLGLTKDEELIVMFMLGRASSALDLVRESSVGDFQLLARGVSLSSDSKDFIDHLAPSLFKIATHLHDANDRASANNSSHGSVDRDRLERLRKIRCNCLRAFGAVVELWMMRSIEDATDCIAQVFCGSNDPEVEEDDDFGRASITGQLEKYTFKFCSLFDSFAGKDMLEEATAVLEIIKIVWGKLPSDVLSRFDIWMKSTLTRRRFQTQKLLENMVLVFLRPQGHTVLNTQMALQMSNGLFHNCNGEGELPFPIKSVNFNDRLQLDELDDKNVTTVVSAMLTKSEQAMTDLEPRIKEFCAQQLRQALKLREEEANLLQTFEEENGFSALNVNIATAQYQAAFKGYCRRVFDLAGILMPFAMMDLSKAALPLRIIRLIGRLYKLLTLLVTCKLRRKETTLPKYLQRLFDRTASELSPILLQFIACIHEEAKRTNANKASKGRGGAGTIAAQSKLIPDVIYQMEQFDLILIKLSKLCKDRDFSAWCKLRQSRDFRFNRDKIKERLEESKAEKGYRGFDENGDEAGNDVPEGSGLGDHAAHDDSDAEVTESAEFRYDDDDDDEVGETQEQQVKRQRSDTD